MLLRIASSRIGGEFQHASDEYLIRPAEQDFWRLESSQGGKSYVTRIVSSSEGEESPDVFEIDVEMATTAGKIAGRIVKMTPAPISTPNIDMDSVGISRSDEFLLMDGGGHTYPLGKSLNTPHCRAMPQRVREAMNLLQNLYGRVLGQVNDQGWGKQYRSLVDFLEHKGPVQFGSTDFKTLTDQIYGLADKLDAPAPAGNSANQESLSER